jgi:hypothetical protein
MQIVNHVTSTLQLTDTVTTRSYPFTQKTLDQIRDLRQEQQDDILEDTGEHVMVPAPVVISTAIDELHKQIFGSKEE